MQEVLSMPFDTGAHALLAYDDEVVKVMGVKKGAKFNCKRRGTVIMCPMDSNSSIPNYSPIPVQMQFMTARESIWPSLWVATSRFMRSSGMQICELEARGSPSCGKRLPTCQMPSRGFRTSAKR